MSRPVDPNWTVGSWATNANHPAGADDWNGQPTKVQHPGPAGGFAPGQGAAAEYFNFEFNRIYATQASEKTYAQALANFVGQSGVQNFRLADATGVENTTVPFYDAFNRRWLAPCNGTLRNSRDNGCSWPEVVGASTPFTGEVGHSGDTDNAGNYVVTTKTRYAVTGTTKVDVLGSAPGIDIEARVVFDPVHARWCWLSSGIGLHSVKTSTNRTTWASGAFPGGGSGSWGNDHSVTRMACDRASGRIVAVAKSIGVGAASVATTDDGGQTWTVRSDIASLPSTSSSSDRASLILDAGSGQFIYAIGNALLNTSKIFRSTDGGVTWTLVTSFTTVCVHSVAVLGALWAATVYQNSGQRHDVAFSVDAGGTWKWSGFSVGDTSGGIVAANGGFVVASNSQKIYASWVGGLPTFAALT